MRLLILSEIIIKKQKDNAPPYEPHYDVELVVGDPAESNFSLSLFDFDVSIVHISHLEDLRGYYYSLPKITRDSKMSLENGRTIILLPESENFLSRTSTSIKTLSREKQVAKTGLSAYEWIEQFGLTLQENKGTNIKPSGNGRAKTIQDYLKIAPNYYQVLSTPKLSSQEILAIVDNTEIVVGLEYKVLNGTLVILPPPVLPDSSYIYNMSLLVDVAKRYYDRAQRRIPISDSPDWLNSYLVPRAIQIHHEIEVLSEEKEQFDRLSYVLFGTGDELEMSVALMLEKIGLTVEPQPKGSNIDLKVINQKLDIKFAVEVTGTKDIIKKESNKVAQAWQYIHDRVGTPDESNKLIIIANTQCHIEPAKRDREAFSTDFSKLLSDNGVLLMTTVQLYNLWKLHQGGSISTDDISKSLYEKTGVYRFD